ncbi:MAG: NAD(P)-dependent oxidoreductase [Hyphomicrobium sp.]|nr:NAD(P)-dependent oxidoreductase [Hyphomicrobium sp.]
MSVVLLTGGSGFVGRQIHKHLAARGHEVRLALRPGAQARLAAGAVVDAIVETDDLFAETPDWWAEACSGVDAVIHAAWYVEPGRYLDSPENARCVAGSFALAQGAREAGVGHFIGIGTCFEYRLPSRHLDVDAPLGPATLYAASKVALYHMLAAWHAKQGGVFSWCRIFYLFGEGEHPNRLVPYLRGCLEAGETARLSAGTQLRDFLDVAEAGAMIADVIDTGQPGAINVCSGEEITIRAFAERIADGYGRRDLLEFGAAQVHPSDPSSVVGICNAIRSGHARRQG